MSPQLPLTLRAPPDQRFDAFLAADAVRDAVRAAARGERADWLYLDGPPGSGKTHLLLAACAEAGAAGRRAAYLPLAGFAGHLAAMLPAQEGAELLCLDGLDAVAGHGDDEEALFHMHNRARAAGTTVLYAATAGPAALPLVLPDLRTRLAQCVRLSLSALDDTARRGLELDDAVLDYLLRRVDRDLGSLTVLLDRLDRESLAAQRRITIPFLRDVIGSH